jgi:hypothetical protein
MGAVVSYLPWMTLIHGFFWFAINIENSLKKPSPERPILFPPYLGLGYQLTHCRGICTKIGTPSDEQTLDVQKMDTLQRLSLYHGTCARQSYYMHVISSPLSPFVSLQTVYMSYLYYVFFNIQWIWDASVQKKKEVFCHEEEV